MFVRGHEILSWESLQQCSSFQRGNCDNTVNYCNEAAQYCTRVVVCIPRNSASSHDLVELRFRNSTTNCDVVVAGRRHRRSATSLLYGSKTSWTESQRRVVDEIRSSMLTFSNLLPKQLPCNRKQLLQPLAVTHQLQKATRFSKPQWGCGVLLP